MAQNDQITPEQYNALAEFRFQIRAFAGVCDESARAAGLKPLEYQFLLSLKRHDQRGQVSISQLAERLRMRPSRLLLLVEAMARQKLIERRIERREGRVVFIHLTPKGEAKLRQISLWHCGDLQSRAPVLRQTLSGVCGDAGE